MDGLTPGQANELVEAIDEAHRARTLAEFPSIAISVVSRLVRSEMTSFNDVDPRAQTVIAEFQPERPIFEGAFDVFARLQLQHPVIRYVGETGDGSAHKISDFLDQEAFHATALYREFYERLDIDYQMSVSLPAVSPRIIGIALNRSTEAGDFDERDRLFLNLLRPHLAQAYEHVRLRAELDAHRHLSGRVLSDLRADAILLSDEPVELRPGALDRLRRAFGASSANELPTDVKVWVEAQRTLANSDPSDRLARPLEPLTGAIDGERIVARLLLSGPVGSDESDRSDGDVIVISRSPHGVTIAELARLGLSAREAEVMHAVMNGATNAAIGRSLDISAGTVKKHLDHIYAKLGVSGRTRAAAYCLELLASEGSPRNT